MLLFLAMQVEPTVRQLLKNFSFLAQKCPQITQGAACYSGNGPSAAGWLQERIWVGPPLGGLGKSEWLGDLPWEWQEEMAKGICVCALGEGRS